MCASAPPMRLACCSSRASRGELDLAALRRRAIRARRRSAHYHLAMSYAVGPGRRSTAIALARRATGIAPDAAHAWHHLGIHLDDAGQVAEARGSCNPDRRDGPVDASGVQCAPFFVEPVRIRARTALRTCPQGHL